MADVVVKDCRVGRGSMHNTARHRRETGGGAVEFEPWACRKGQSRSDRRCFHAGSSRAREAVKKSQSGASSRSRQKRKLDPSRTGKDGRCQYEADWYAERRDGRGWFEVGRWVGELKMQARYEGGGGRERSNDGWLLGTRLAGPLLGVRAFRPSSKQPSAKDQGPRVPSAQCCWSRSLSTQQLSLQHSGGHAY